MFRKTIARLDSVLLEGMLRVVELMRDVEEGLGGNAPNVQASAAECPALLNTHRVEPELRSADRARIARRAAAQDGDVELVAERDGKTHLVR